MSDAIARPASLDDRVDDIAAVIDAAEMVRPVLLALSDSTPVCGARGLGLRIRAGLHTGECDLVGADVAGLAVHVGARFSALAGADEILMTGSVRNLLTQPSLNWQITAGTRSRECRGSGGSTG